MARDLAVFTQLPNELLKIIGSWFYYLQKIRATYPLLAACGGDIVCVVV